MLVFVCIDKLKLPNFFIMVIEIVHEITSYEPFAIEIFPIGGPRH